MYEGKKPPKKGPLISAYRFKPTVAYELGGVVQRDVRVTGLPSNTISRLLFGLDMDLEFERIVTLAVTNTYYFLEQVPRRPNRDYAEARFELNTGYLFNRNLNGLQSAFLVKFQRGFQPPTFGPVNALSVGFKIYR